MLRITQKTSGTDTAKYFFGYYSETELDKPVWLGKGAEKLGLEGKAINAKDFEAISNNINPETGKQITERMAANRTSSYDFTFSVPKSVSIIYGLTQDKEILAKFNEAVLKTMKEVEQASEVRVRKNGVSENRQAGNLTYGVFTHGETRPIDGASDPQLHKHVIVQNLVYDEMESKWKAGQFRNIKANAPYYQTLFRSHFAKGITEIGYDIERSKSDFEVKGFDRGLIDKFSRRTLEIEDKAKELGLEYAEDKAALGAKTRASKIENINRDEMQQEWRGRLTEREENLIHSAKNSTNGDDLKITPEQALDYSIAHSLERKSVVSEKELLVTGLKRSYGQVTPDELRESISLRSDLLSKQDKYGEKLFTTKQALIEEKTLIKSAREGLGVLKPINEGYVVQNEQLTDEQALAVQHVVNSKDFITAISGKAGVGKTYSIKEVANAVDDVGMSFVAVAPSAEASRTVQRDEGFEGATTVADLLQNEKLHERIKDGVLWVDEISLVGNKTMTDVITLAKKQNARLLLTGDSYQHNSPERGDAYRILQKYGGVEPANINKIQRQKRDDYREAVSLISEGDVSSGFTKLDEMGAIKEAETMNDLYHNAADEYVKSAKAKEQILTVSTTHAQGRMFTGIVRDKLKQEKLISGKERLYQIQSNLNFTNAEKTDPNNYKEGQIVQFHQHVKGGIKRGEKYRVSEIGEDGRVFIVPKNFDENSETENQTTKNSRLELPKTQTARFSVYEQNQINLAKGDLIRVTQNGFSQEKHRLNNGNMLTVKRIDKEGNIIASTGKKDVTIDKDFGNINLGYYSTSQASQGKTVNKVIIMQSSMSGLASNKEQLYVSASRGRFSISIHTDDKEHLLESAKRTSQRMTALEIANSAKNPDNRVSRVNKEKNKSKNSIQIDKEKIAKRKRIEKIKLTQTKQVKHGRSGPTK